MISHRILDVFPLVNDVSERYTFLRSRGYDPTESRQKTLEEFAREMEDEDDAVVVLSGIALSQWDAAELEEKTTRAVVPLIENRITQTDEIEEKRVFKLILQTISKEKKLPDRKKAPPKKIYANNWEIGDTFAHRLVHPDAEKAGIMGWYLLLRKTGCYENWKGNPIQLGYLTVCPESMLPRTTSELNSLGFLRVMNHGKKWDYLVQVNVQSKRAENALKLERIGRFMDAAAPVDEMECPPEVAMPFFGGIDKATGCPQYEDAICHFYKMYGLGCV